MQQIRVRRNLRACAEALGEIALAVAPPLQLAASCFSRDARHALFLGSFCLQRPLAIQVCLGEGAVAIVRDACGKRSWLRFEWESLCRVLVVEEVAFSRPGWVGKRGRQRQQIQQLGRRGVEVAVEYRVSSSQPCDAGQPKCRNGRERSSGGS